MRVNLPRVDDGPGVKLGNQSRLHPGVALGVGYDSNVFSSHAPLPVRDAMFLLPTAWLGVGNRPVRGGLLDSPPEPTSRLLDYNISIAGGQRVYLARRESVKGAGRFNIGARLRLLVAPARRFSLAVNADLNRLGEPRNYEATSEYNFDRIDTAFGIHAIVRPGGGRLAMRFGYVNYQLYFLALDLDKGDRHGNGFEHETKWRVRDRSAFVVRYSWLWTYYNCCATSGTGRNEDSKAHRVLGGFVGQVGKRAELEALAGYGYARYHYDVNGPNLSKGIGRVAGSYYPTPRTRLHLAGEYTFRDALFGNFHVLMGGEAFASHQFRWNMTASVGANLYYRRTAGLPVPGQEIETVDRYDPATMGNGYQREDMLYSGTAKVEQMLGRFFVLGLQYVVNIDDTGFVIYYEDSPYPAPGAFARQQVMLISAIRY